MLSRWLGGLAAAAVALVACVLVILDVTDAGLRRWWDAHALTTDTVAGLLVLMITVLLVDQVVRLRQGNSRARAVAIQVAILMTQAEQRVAGSLPGTSRFRRPGQGVRRVPDVHDDAAGRRAGTDRRQGDKELPRASPAPRR